jgi:hypothetical protein|nr:MAG TPA: hypothetical protein [Caudoviricetes sp.]
MRYDGMKKEIITGFKKIRVKSREDIIKYQSILRTFNKDRYERNPYVFYLVLDSEKGIVYKFEWTYLPYYPDSEFTINKINGIKLEIPKEALDLYRSKLPFVEESVKLEDISFVTEGYLYLPFNILAMINHIDTSIIEFDEMLDRVLDFYIDTNHLNFKGIKKAYSTFITVDSIFLIYIKKIVGKKDDDAIYEFTFVCKEYDKQELTKYVEENRFSIPGIRLEDIPKDLVTSKIDIVETSYYPFLNDIYILKEKIYKSCNIETLERLNKLRGFIRQPVLNSVFSNDILPES